MKTYYHLSVPGLLTSLCLPVYNIDQSLFGVACSDLTVSNLLSDVSYLSQGENSYSIIIDGQGRTGIPIGCLCWIDRHWLVKHYNVEYSYFN